MKEEHKKLTSEIGNIFAKIRKDTEDYSNNVLPGKWEEFKKEVDKGLTKTEAFWKVI